MSSPAFDLTRLFGTGLPDPSPRFAGFPEFNFIGGHNDPEHIPIEGLIEAAASVLRREGASLAMYISGAGRRVTRGCAISSPTSSSATAVSTAGATTS